MSFEPTSNLSTDSNLTPLEQFNAYTEYEKKHNPPPPGKIHICEWALNKLYEYAGEKVKQ